MYDTRAGVALEEAMCRALDVRNPNNPLIRTYYRDGFFLFKENKNRIRVISHLRQFFGQSFPEAETIFEKLAEIPFPIVVTLTPDRLFSNMMRKKSIEHQCDFYHFGQSFRPLETPLNDLPMVYNMLGWVEEDESLVLTHNDLFGYLEAVFIGGRMNPDLKTELMQANNYIFLGLPFHKWYMQLLLRVLSLHVDGAKFDRISPKPTLTQRTRSMYEEQFKIQFVDENIEHFVGELYERCKKDNMLRKVDAVPEAAVPTDTVSLDAIVDLVAYAETKKALEGLRGILTSLRNKNAKYGGFYNDAVLLMSRFEQLDRKFQQGMAYSQEDNVERAKINYDLLALINNIRESGGQPGAAV